MDQLDQRILALLCENARMPVKDIARQVSLTSPAVSSRIRKMEREGIIARYTVVLNPQNKGEINALVSVSSLPAQRDALTAALQEDPQVQKCFHVTGSYSYIAKVCCPDMAALEHLITQLQTYGQTSTQIILSTPVDRPAYGYTKEE